MSFFHRLGLAYRARRYRTRVDPDEIRWMRSVLRRGDAAIDVGAYKGGYTYWMRREVAETGTVLAFEPQPTLAAYLRQCVRAFGWKNVFVDEAALSSERGMRTLLVPGGGPSPGASLEGASLPAERRPYDVHVDTLDGVLEARPVGGPLRLLKCDVEGHELDVFRGASGTLERHRPHLLFECERRHLREHGMEDVFAHLEGLGYRGSFFLGGQLVDVDRFEPATHQVEGRRPYVNNFVFVHRSETA